MKEGTWGKSQYRGRQGQLKARTLGFFVSFVLSDDFSASICSHRMNYCFSIVSLYANSVIQVHVPSKVISRNQAGLQIFFCWVGYEFYLVIMVGLHLHWKCTHMCSVLSLGPDQPLV